MKHDNGFTLIELLIVIVIVGILAAIVVFAVSATEGPDPDPAGPLYHQEQIDDTICLFYEDGTVVDNTCRAAPSPSPR